MLATVPTFGMSCYETSNELEWGQAVVNPDGTITNNCRSSTGKTKARKSYTISGYRTNPPGDLMGSFCKSFLQDTKVQGSGLLRDGNTKIEWQPGGAGGRWVSVGAYSTKDSTAPKPGQTVARDRNIITQRGVKISIHALPQILLADDTGGRTKGYRLDLYGGLGQHACDNFTANPQTIAAC